MLDWRVIWRIGVTGAAPAVPILVTTLWVGAPFLGLEVYPQSSLLSLCLYWRRGRHL